MIPAISKSRNGLTAFAIMLREPMPAPPVVNTMCSGAGQTWLAPTWSLKYGPENF